MKAQVPYILIAFFLITQFLGLYVGNQYIQLINAGEIPRPFEGTPLGNPEAVTTSLYLFGYIIVSTVIILLVIRIRKSAIRIFEALIVFMASWFTLDFLIPLDIGFLSLGFFLALALTAWKVLKPNIINQDIAAILSGAFVGSALGVSLGILPSIIFILILSTYDFISVFITKHMVYMAKALTERPTSFTVAAPPNLKSISYAPAKKSSKKKVHIFQLGVGDMVIPLMFSVSVLNSFKPINAIAAIVGSAVALLALIYFMSKKPRPLPALPFITFGTFAGFLISMLI